ncbi:MAG: hypothetical protein U0T77_10385 [Chitinophagales bacterium]
MNGKTFNVGSEWRIWDLHIHTPGTKKNDQFTGATLDEKWKNYIESINNSPQKISVIGITDYFSIENYFKFKDYVNNGSIIKQFDLVIPNVELRVLPVTGSATPINLHCLFNPSLDTELETRFLAKLQFSNSRSNYSATKSELVRFGRDHSNNPNLDEESAYKKGVEQFVITLDALNLVFKNDPNLRENTIIVASNRSTDGITGVIKHEDFFVNKTETQLDATRQSLYQFSDALFSSNEKDKLYFTGKSVDEESVVIRKCGSLKPCYHGCDAHSNDKIFKPDENRYCWIKSDPTFEGLKQTLYEPDERVKIQETNPALDFEKFAFTEIEVENPLKVFQNEPLQFEKSIIPINQNLVTIIGGRGAGKSVLINYFANGFKQFNPTEKSNFNLSADFKVKWKKSLQSADEVFSFVQQHDLPFLFISQSEVKEKVKNTKDLGDEIKKILELETLSFDRKTDDIIQEYKTDFNTNKEWFDKKDENNNPINTKEFVDSEIAKNKTLIDRITTAENKEKLEKYSVNIEKLQSNQTDKLNLEQLKISLTEFQNNTNTTIAEINKNIPTIDFKLQLEAIAKAIIEIDDTVKTAQDENTQIKEEFKEFKGDISSLLSNVERFKISISIYERRKKEIEEKEKQLSIALTNKKTIGNLLNAELQRQKLTIDESWSKLLRGKESWNAEQKELMKKIINNREIKIEGEIIFNKIAFYFLLKEQLDGRTFKGKNDYIELKNLVEIKDIASYIDFLINIDTSIKKIEYYLRYGKEELEKIFYDLQTRSRYLYVQPQISYKGKSLDKISVGQRGTIYLCLKLATNIFSQTIIFDQPEDDLDNDFIFNDLINIFKEIKRYRQVIIVTHNANIVVNADAEQVIVAENNEEKLSYKSGSLENPNINIAVCNILEGGKIAFQQRRNKYNLN